MRLDWCRRLLLRMPFRVTAGAGVPFRPRHVRLLREAVNQIEANREDAALEALEQLLEVLPRQFDEE